MANIGSVIRASRKPRECVRFAEGVIARSTTRDQHYQLQVATQSTDVDAEADEP